ncbi:M15 family metallopeptidase [Phenylobacterium sp.]|uniref:M15 family metallopeptidase n=1 Tax=Phenylobacterium sp. TaxID=1871053 RepID=UPI00286B28BC|nr:M15 family metallopeptidase [Phenylobacterium sp.]
MSYAFGKRSLDRLQGVHPDLVRVMKRAISCSTLDFSIIEGMRTLATQKKYFAAGATRTMNSRHLTGHAVDVAPYVDGVIRWDWPLYYEMAKVIKKAAAEEKVPVQWGGDWKSFKDGPHWELTHKAYPAKKP